MHFRGLLVCVSLIHVFLILKEFFVKGAKIQTAPCVVTKNKKAEYLIDCSHRSWKTVPKCEQLNVTDCTKISELNLSWNPIKYLGNGSFLDYPGLKVLNMSFIKNYHYEDGCFENLRKLHFLDLHHLFPHSHQMYLGKNLFKPLINLKYLDISNLRLNIAYVFQKVLCGLPSSVETLLLDKVFHITDTHSIMVLDGAMSTCLRHMKLKKLSLKGNRIVVIKDEFVKSLKHLEYISVRKNILIGDKSAMIEIILRGHNLTFWDLGCQHKWSCDKEYVQPLPIPLPKQKLNVQYRAEKRDKFQFDRHGGTIYIQYLLQNLHTLRYDNWPGQDIDAKIPNICLVDNHLVELDLSYTNIKSVKGKLHCLWHLRHLYLRGLKSTYIDPTLFQDMSSLQILLLRETMPSEQLGANYSSEFFKNNKNLIYLELSKNNIFKLNERVFENLLYLRFLDLSQNLIESLDHVLDNLTSLEHVNVSQNKLVNFPINVLKILENNPKNDTINTTLDITENPFQCTCNPEVPENIKHLYETKVHIFGLNSSNLFCFLPNNSQILLKDAIQVLEKLCHSYNKVDIIIAYITYTISLLIIILSTFMYWHQWKVKYAWYTVLQIFYAKEQRKTNYKFDAFICYCSKDEDWVRTNFAPKLERHNYKLCLHYRHFIPGRWISDNIVAAIKSSKTTIIIVTQKYLRSGWCDFETKFAHAHHLHKRTAGLIAIVHPGGLDAKRWRTDLGNLLDTFTYLEWPEDEYLEENFWLSLRRSLGDPIRQRVDDDNTSDVVLL